MPDDTLSDIPPGRAARFFSGISLVLSGLFLLVSISELKKISVPGAPVLWVYAAIALCGLATLLHIPPLFKRLPPRVRLTAFVAPVLAFIAFGIEIDKMKPVWERTPEGAKEVAERAASERQAAADRARESARLKAEGDAAAQIAAEEKQAGLEAQKADVCRTLAEQTVDGEKVLEVNNISVEPFLYQDEKLTCSGDAITSHGEMRIQFGLVTTPQGKTLVSTRFP